MAAKSHAIISDENRKVSVFMEDVMYDIRCEISRQHPYRANSLALLRIDGDPDAQYAKLWSYADEIRKNKPWIIYFDRNRSR
ncbi:hypothetical protein ACS0TY_022384 [Phlomoides rotata]